MARTVNFLLYQTGWFACVLGAAYSHRWLGVASATSLLAVHIVLTTERERQARLLLVAFGVGLVVDSTLLAIGVCRFSAGGIVAWVPPIWMSVLWIQFATTLRYCLLWMSGRYGLSALFGFVGAPLAFLGGERLGAILFLEPRLANLTILAVLWALAIPLLIYTSDRIHVGAKTAAGYRGFLGS